MAFTAYLKIEGQEIPLVYAALEVNQEIDQRGRPSSMVRGGQMSLEFYSQKNPLIAKWMADPKKILNGSIDFMQNFGPSVLRTIVFENAYCIHYYEKFDNYTASDSMTTMITISPEIITINGSMKLDNRWHIDFE